LFEPGPGVDLIPRPAKVSKLEGAGITGGGRPGRNGKKLVPPFRLHAADADLAETFQRFLVDVRADGISKDPSSDSEIPLTLVLRDHVDADTRPPTGVTPDGADLWSESYELRIDRNGIVIAAPGRAGIFRGLTTLRQMMADPPDSGVVISDSPMYAWRGLSLDVARTFFDVETVKRVVDILSLYKFNVLHLHLTDDQGWRIEIPELPRLAEVGGSRALGDRPGGFYSVAQFEDIVAYAAERFVTVVPEVDMPGHCAAALLAYPALASAPGDRGAGTNLLNPDDPEVAAFVGTVLGSVATLTKGAYLHIGGDEAFGMSPDAYDRFLALSRASARAVGKLAVTWEDAARTSEGGGDLLQHWISFDPELESMLSSGDFESMLSSGEIDASSLPPDIAIPPELLPAIAEHFAKAKGELRIAIERGAAVILSPASHVYLDRPYRESSIDSSQEDWRSRLGLSAYPRATVEQAYSWEPRGALDRIGAGPEASRSSVVGIEAAMWAETVADESELKFMLLPRLPGVAERAWSSGPRAPWAEYRWRLARQRAVWQARGWGHFASSLVPW
jgi:hexosaminidase